MAWETPSALLAREAVMPKPVHRMTAQPALVGLAYPQPKSHRDPNSFIIDVQSQAGDGGRL